MNPHLTVLVLAVLLPATVHSIKCYECQGEDNLCQVGLLGERVTCSPGVKHCYKSWTVETQPQTKRKCGSHREMENKCIDHLHEQTPYGMLMLACYCNEGDYCNSANSDRFSRANMALVLPVLLTALLSTHTIRHQMFDISWWTLAISVQYVPSIKSTQLHNNLVNPNTLNINFWWRWLLKLKQIWGNSNAETIRTFTPNVTTCHITWTQQSWWLTIWVIHISSFKLAFLRLFPQTQVLFLLVIGFSKGKKNYQRFKVNAVILIAN